MHQALKQYEFRRISKKLARSDEDARGTTGTSADNAAMEMVHSQILSDIPSFLDGAVAKR
jgi:hypothetical protein